VAKANPNVDAVRLDYADPGAITPALVGISAMVLMGVEGSRLKPKR